jgi:hypothetical protein
MASSGCSNSVPNSIKLTTTNNNSSFYSLKDNNNNSALLNNVNTSCNISPSLRIKTKSIENTLVPLVNQVR